jgi:hypothetical protein
MTFLVHQGHGAQSCTNLLPKTQNQIDLNYPIFNSNPEAIARPKRNEQLLKMYEKSIVELPMGLQPLARNQCWGTCYMYSSQTLVENKLKKKGLIPVDSLALSAPHLALLASKRLNNVSEGFIDLGSLLHSGTNEFMENLRGSSFFYVERSPALVKIGMKTFLDIERAFMTDFFENLSYSHLGKNFYQHLLSSPKKITSIVAEAFKAYLETSHGFTIDLMQVPVERVEHSINVVVREESAFFPPAVYPLDWLKNPLQILAFEANPLMIGSLEFSLISDLVDHLSKQNFVKVSLPAEVFGGAHAVVLTNLVVDPKTKQLIGFVYLNSHGENFSTQGYGFIHAAEAARLILEYEVINDVY